MQDAQQVASDASAPAGSRDGPRRETGRWREVSVVAYRRLTTISTFAGALVLAWGIWQIAHLRLVSGVLLVVAGFVVGLWTMLLRIEGTPALYHGGRQDTKEQWAPRVLHFYTRRECTLCEEARARLEPELKRKGITLVSHDVDEDPVLRKRYGARVPVAVYQGDEVFALQYDADAVRILD